ncbi:MAG: MFS transporter [Marinovum sp.]|nr:MFS transporter [Marinovum sp.]
MRFPLRIIYNSPKNAVFFGFFIYAVGLGTLFPRIADLQSQMEIDKATLGLALVGLPAGVQVTLLFADRLVRRIPFKVLLGFGVPVIGISQCLAAFSGGPLGFFFSLALGGAAVALIEVAVNLEADRVEAKIEQRIMNRSHAFWSFGFFGASIFGAGVAQLGMSPLIHFTIIMVFTTVITNLVFSNYVPAEPRRKTIPKKGSTLVWPSKAIFMLVLFTLSAMLVEGSAIDWSIIYMRDEFNAMPLIGGLSLACAALSQALVRYYADPLVDRYGPRSVALTSVIAMSIGVFFVVFAVFPTMALVGFLLMGGGSAVIFPLAMSAAAGRNDRTPEENVAALAQFAFATFLIAPPLLGIIAEGFGLRIAFAISLPLIALSYFQLKVLEKTPADPPHMKDGSAG